MGRNFEENMGKKKKPKIWEAVWFGCNNKFGIVWSLLIVSVCIIPGSNLSGTSFLDSFGVDKVIHAFLYLMLVSFVAKGFMQYSISFFTKRNALIVAFLYSLTLGISIEFIQSAFIKGRTGDVYDVLANIFGTIVGVIMIAKTKLSPKLDLK